MGVEARAALVLYLIPSLSLRARAESQSRPHQLLSTSDPRSPKRECAREETLPPAQQRFTPIRGEGRCSSRLSSPSLHSRSWTQALSAHCAAACAWPSLADSSKLGHKSCHRARPLAPTAYADTNCLQPVWPCLDTGTATLHHTASCLYLPSVQWGMAHRLVQQSRRLYINTARHNL